MQDIGSIVSRLESSVSALERTIARDENILISCTEAARHIGCTNTTITRMLKEGRLHRVTIDSSSGIRLSEVMKIRTP